jgi:MFS family permease
MSQPYDRAPRYVRLLLYSSGAWYLGEGMIAPFFSLYTNSIGGSILDITWVWATYLIIAGIFTVVVGKISDTWISKEKLIIVGYVLNAVLTFGYLLVGSTWHLFLIQAGLGIATALATPTWNALYEQHGDTVSSGLRWGYADGQEQIVTGIATVVGGLVIQNLSYTVLFLIMGVVQTCAAFFQAQMLSGSGRPQRQEPGFEQLTLF